MRQLIDVVIMLISYLYSLRLATILIFVAPMIKYLRVLKNKYPCRFIK